MKVTRTVGLTLGKYAPLHKGHQLVIDTAFREMDEVIVMIYDSPEFTNVPLTVRARWIRKLYPTITVIECWNGPSAMGSTPEIQKLQEDYVIKKLDGKKITHFYCGESYGEHMSKALSAVDRRIDRSILPTSGTALRADPYAGRQFIDPIVYRDLIVNVAFIGAPSTGKSTIAEALAKEHDTVFMPEYGREYWMKNQVNHRLTPWQLVELATEHKAREDEVILQANRVLFTDSTALTTYVFSQYYHGRVLSHLTGLALMAQSEYDLVFLCDTDIPFDDTWDRSGAVSREIMQKMILADLHMRKIPYIVLRGSLSQRMRCVGNVLKGYTKYTNMLRAYEYSESLALPAHPWPVGGI